MFLLVPEKICFEVGQKKHIDCPSCSSRIISRRKSRQRKLRKKKNGSVNYGRPSPPKMQGCQIDQQVQSWFKDQLHDRIANKGMDGQIIDGLVFLHETEHPKQE